MDGWLLEGTESSRRQQRRPAMAAVSDSYHFGGEEDGVSAVGGAGAEFGELMDHTLSRPV